MELSFDKQQDFKFEQGKRSKLDNSSTPQSSKSLGKKSHPQKKLKQPKLPKISTRKRKEFNCPTCKKPFRTKTKLNVHEKIHLERTTLYTCEICEKPFVHKSNSYNHKYTHMNLQELETAPIFHQKCEICDRLYFSKRDYEDHINKHLEIKNFSCNLCGRTFSQKRSIKKHMELIHSTDKDRMKAEKSFKFECEICKMKFWNASRLNRHSVSHTNKKAFQCDDCDQKFSQKYSLTSHVKTVHLKIKTFFCELCDVSFAKSCNLKSHLKRVHHVVMDREKVEVLIP